MMDAARPPRRPRGPLVVAVVCASLSGAAVLSHAAGVLAMPYFITVVSLPSALLFVALYVRSWSLPHAWLVQRIGAGLWMGAAGTLAYDVIRWVLVRGLTPGYSPFRTITLLGTLILDRPESDPWTHAAGWAYHVWNGLMFAVMYVLVVGRGKWLYGVAWAMVLEGLTIVAYPGIFQISRWDPGFLGTSLVGHLAYGATLGILSQRREYLPIPGA